jgi:uncharacterized membrane protein YeaQ/YmgE (transglycosylase-associated protein family)
MLYEIIGLLLSGLVVGGLARFALPGPDPMPLWATIGLGVAGSFLGGLVAAALGMDAGDPGAFFLLALAGAGLILYLYRRLVQKRPLTGPGAQQRPLPPKSLRRTLLRQPHDFLDATATPGDEPLEQLAKLVALRDAGGIDAAEFERRKAALVERL